MEVLCMAYSRRDVKNGITIMDKDLYDNLQDGIEEAKKAVETSEKNVKEELNNNLPKKVKTLVVSDILVIE